MPSPQKLFVQSPALIFWFHCWKHTIVSVFQAANNRMCLRWGGSSLLLHVSCSSSLGCTLLYPRWPWLCRVAYAQVGADAHLSPLLKTQRILFSLKTISKCFPMALYGATSASPVLRLTSLSFAPSIPVTQTTSFFLCAKPTSHPLCLLRPVPALHPQLVLLVSSCWSQLKKNLDRKLFLAYGVENSFPFHFQPYSFDSMLLHSILPTWNWRSDFLTSV